MKSPSFLEESCLGKSFSPSRGEQPCHFSPVQDIFHNYKEELSHNGSTQLQLIVSPLLAFTAGPCSASRRAPPSIREMNGGQGISLGQCSSCSQHQLCAGGPGQMGGASSSGGSQAGPHTAGVKASRFRGGNGKEMCTASSPRPSSEGQLALPPPHLLLMGTHLLLSSIRVWGFPSVSLPAALPAWHWSQQHPAIGCLCTAGGAFAAE